MARETKRSILDIANKKAVIEKDILIYRLKAFPLIWLDKIKKIKDIEITRDKIDILCDDILEEKSNSLVVVIWVEVYNDVGNDLHAHLHLQNM